jgi:ABC-type multidrug transport system permease subunit
MPFNDEGEPTVWFWIYLVFFVIAMIGLFWLVKFPIKF